MANVEKQTEKEVNPSELEAYTNLEDRVLILNDVVPKFDKPWYKHWWLIKLDIFLFGSILAQITSGFDGSSMNGLQSLPSWQSYFDHPKGAILGTMSNGPSIGTLICIPLSFWIIDYLGRKRVVLLGCCIIVIGAVIQGAAQNFGMFTGARILLGIGSCLSSAAAGPLLSETAYPTQRPAITALLLASWPFGSFVAAMVTWGPYRSSLKYNNWSWRIPSILQCFFPLLQILIVSFGPESPRWLISKGREHEARNFFVKYHAGGDENSKLVAFEMAEIKAILAQEQNQISSKFTEWFRSKQRLRRLFIVAAVPAMVQLCGNALISYYLSIVLTNIGITDSNDQLKINIGMTVYGLFWSVGVGINVDRFKRRKMFMTGFALMCVTYVIWTILSSLNQQQNFENKSLSSGVVAMIYLFSGFYHIASPVAMTYVMEVCPFHLRAQGSTIYQLSGNVIGFFNNYVNPIAMNAITWKYYIVWCIWLVVQICIVYFIFPETKGLGLEEIAQVFGEDVTEGLVAADQAIRGKENDLDSEPSKAEVEEVEYTSK
ncbi:hypothetical protein PSN45_000480 [Yamadazyma tenuis]|uniref:Major facilitator superfamily (MFS) profile domain-containing protein n=1 Tax=Candida tenuis (strain ATCC 10573 / BCRC 21748 / CBS 615 / JCM 9827 / NBRC 10315 / NRRL Y-1498 / VKM Y-70) TaxID=590646 RepID=G3B8W9_CANTC|nr:uncharacterized protein CANTEDRAFT_109673 [Yamadazyma tenuis ATCC 10573]EGV61796.1 hypothetical protein CANTEDRAFT_109673 [Yamadazyma tenuis ATCC 10573]WEJ93021.1 hypothetical protein PSN45_000480 [Yamadazyma tenuis]